MSELDDAAIEVLAADDNWLEALAIVDDATLEICELCIALDSELSLDDTATLEIASEDELAGAEATQPFSKPINNKNEAHCRNRTITLLTILAMTFIMIFLFLSKKTRR